MKKLLALLLTCAMVLSLGLLAGCGQTDPGDANGDSQSAAETDGQNTDTNTGDLEKIVFTEDVRGYHWAPAYLAQTLGYFKEEGLDAEFQTIKGGDATAPVLSGDAQFCLKGVETSLMVNEGGQGIHRQAHRQKKQFRSSHTHPSLSASLSGSSLCKTGRGKTWLPPAG